MKRYILILVALIAGMAVHAEDLQKKALADYDNKNYAAAIDDYQQLEKQSGVSAEYYFNLGNAYYRSGKKGKAILCYERALRLNPRYEKAQANLDFVNMKIIDRPEPEENILAVGFRNVQNAMSPTAWTVVAMAAFLLFIAGMAAYAASKSALQGMARGLARDFGPRGITINVVQPGPIDTDANPANGPMRDMLHSLMAIKRHGQPEEVAGMVAWLAGPEASFVTGAMHTIDGAFGA